MVAKKFIRALMNIPHGLELVTNQRLLVGVWADAELLEAPLHFVYFGRRTLCATNRTDGEHACPQ